MGSLMIQEPGIIRIGYLSTVYHTSFLLKGTGVLQQSGIAAAWTLFASGPDMVHAMSEGDLDLGYIGLPPVIIGRDQGADLSCIAGGHIEGTVLVAGVEVRTLKECSGIPDLLSQFQGRAIGCPPKGSIHDIILRALLQEYGVADVRVINYPWADFIPDALTRGEVAAGAGTPALAVAACRYAGAKIVGPPESLWPYNPSYGIVIPGDTAISRGLLSRFLIVHEAACEHIRHDPSGCARVVSAETGMVDPDFVLAAYRISPKFCAALPDEYLASTMRFARALEYLGYISAPSREDQLFDLSLIRKIHPSPPHYQAGLATTRNFSQLLRMDDIPAKSSRLSGASPGSPPE